MASIRFFFDFISPYAYVGWHTIQRVAEIHSRTVTPIPILFAGLLNHYGHLGPAEIPPKKAFIFKDACRKATRYGLPPLRVPPTHPFNPLLPLRIASVPSMDPRTRAIVIDALFGAAWRDGRDISDAATVSLLLSEALAMHWRPRSEHPRNSPFRAEPGSHEAPGEVDAIVESKGADEAAKYLLTSAGAQRVKDQLRRQTSDAIAQGVFGVPSFVADGELFWGSDTVVDVDAFLAGRDTVDRDYFEKVAQNITPSAERRRPQ